MRHNQKVVADRCDLAAGAGVEPGMSVAHAVALLPRGVGYDLEEWAPDADRVGLELLARWALRLAPTAAAAPPDALLMDATGLERLYGGEEPLRREAVAGLARFGIKAQAAIAPTVGAAWAIARFGSPGMWIVEEPGLAEVLNPLPVSALRLEMSEVAGLAEVGIDHVEQLLDVPREELAERFGMGLLVRIDQALGRIAEPLDPVRDPPPVVAERLFGGPVLQYEAIQAASRELVEDLAAQLHEQGIGAVGMSWEVERLDRLYHLEVVREEISLSHPSRDPRHFWAILSPRVERLHLGHGVERLTLRANRIQRLTIGQATWKGDGWQGPNEVAESGDGRITRQRMSRRGTQQASPESRPGLWSAFAPLDEEAGRLVDLLQARLGRDRVVRAYPVDTHIPEAAVRYAPANEPPPSPHVPSESTARQAADPPPVVAVGRQGPRPTRMLDPPQPIQVTLLRPLGPLMSLRWNDTDHPLIRTIGPERIARRWWQVHPNPNPTSTPNPTPTTMPDHVNAARDYYRVQDHQGLWLWVYQSLTTRKWYVQGVWG